MKKWRSYLIIFALIVLSVLGTQTVLASTGYSVNGETYTLIFDCENGYYEQNYQNYTTVSLPFTSKEVSVGQPLGELPVPTAKGYLLQYWYVQVNTKEGSKVVNSETIFDPEEGEWEFNPETRTVILHGSFVRDPEYHCLIWGGGKFLKVGEEYGYVPDASQYYQVVDGAELLGWEDYSPSKIMEDGDVTLLPYASTSIFLDPNGGDVSVNKMDYIIRYGIGTKVDNLPIPHKKGYDFKGWYTADNTLVDSTTKISCWKSSSSSATSGGSRFCGVTLYAKWEGNGDQYNLGDETYSFENYGDSDSMGGHCFGMSITSAGYYNNLLNIGIIGGNINTPLYSFRLTNDVKKPICKYQAIQGSYSTKATVAGGSFYLNGKNNITSDWQAVVNYVRNHNYDGTGLLQIGFRKQNMGGHAINFLRYESTNGQDRIYAYDNNFPGIETYFYRDSRGSIVQAPRQTFNGAIDCIALRDSRIYFDNVGDFDATHVLYMSNNDAVVQGYPYSYMDALTNEEYVMYEIPEDQESVTIIPKKDNASFVYMDTEYSFGKVTDDTFGVLKLASTDETAGGEGSNEDFRTYNKPTDSIPAIVPAAPGQTVSEQPKATVVTPTGKTIVQQPIITISKRPVSVKAKAKKNKVTVSWKKIKKTKKTKALLAQIAGIEVQYSTDLSFPAENSVKIPLGKKKTKLVLKGLQKGTAYFVRVRYTDGAGGYSNWSAVKRAVAK